MGFDRGRKGDRGGRGRDKREGFGGEDSNSSSFGGGGASGADDPANTLRPSGSLTRRRLQVFEPSLARKPSMVRSKFEMWPSFRSDSRMYSKPFAWSPFCWRGRFEKSCAGIAGHRGSSHSHTSGGVGVPGSPVLVVVVAGSPLDVVGERLRHRRGVRRCPPRRTSRRATGDRGARSKPPRAVCCKSACSSQRRSLDVHGTETLEACQTGNSGGQHASLQARRDVLARAVAGLLQQSFRLQGVGLAQRLEPGADGA